MDATIIIINIHLSIRIKQGVLTIIIENDNLSYPPSSNCGWLVDVDRNSTKEHLVWFPDVIVNYLDVDVSLCLVSFKYVSLLEWFIILTLHRRTVNRLYSEGAKQTRRYSDLHIPIHRGGSPILAVWSPTLIIQG